MPKLELEIVVKPFGATAQKDASKLTGELKKTDAITKALNKTAAGSVKEFAILGRVALDVGVTIASAFSRAAGVVDSINKRIEHSVKHTFSHIKDHIKDSLKFTTGMFLHEGIEKIFDIPKKIFEAGKGNLEASQRLKRQFGTEDAEGYEKLSRKTAGRAGFDDAATTRALFPILEAVDSVQSGTKFGGKKLTEETASALRQKLAAKGASLFERIATVNHIDGEGADQLGYLLGNAGTGPEAMKGLVASLHLNKAFSAKLLKANEKGNAGSVLSPAQIKEFGVKKGQKLGQGDIIDILLQRSGITDKAAEDERKKFGFQMKSIGATFESALGDIGEKVLGKVTGGFAKGATMAEKFQNAIQSPEGKKALDKIAETIGKIVDGVISFATQVPKVFNFIAAHSGVIKTLGGLYLGMSVLGSLRGTLGKALGGHGPQPVFVTNAAAIGHAGAGAGKDSSIFGKLGALAMAASVGYAVGDFLEKKFGLSDKVDKQVGEHMKDVDAAGFGDDEDRRRYRKKLGGLASGMNPAARAKYLKLVNEATAVGADEKTIQSKILEAKEFGAANFHATTNVYLDGKQIAAHTKTAIEKKQVQDAKNSTAGIQ